jgi:PTS system nitrogen regulatory IIA component
MPHRVFNLDEVAAYLHLGKADIERLLKDGEIPFERRGERVVFRRSEIDAWASQRILGFSERRLDEYHQKGIEATAKVLEEEAIIPVMMRRAWIEPDLRAKTKASVLRQMADLAGKTGQVCDLAELVASLEAREALCSTAVPGGLALLHPRHHLPYMFESSFIVLGRSIQDIFFGAPDGQETRLFFLICCQDDRLHLHALARLCLLAQKSDVVAQLLAAPGAEAMHDSLVVAEREVLARRPR